MHLRPIITRIISFYVYLSVLSLLYITSTIYSFMSFVCSREWKIFSHKKMCIALYLLLHSFSFSNFPVLFVYRFTFTLHTLNRYGMVSCIYFFLVYVIKFHWIHFFYIFVEYLTVIQNKNIFYSKFSAQFAFILSYSAHFLVSIWRVFVFGYILYFKILFHFYLQIGV